MKKSTTLLLFVFISVICFEAFLRVSGYSAPVFRRMDPDLGWTSYPGLSGWHRVVKPGYVSINAHGFNDAEVTYEKTDGVFRVAVVGDSFVQAPEVARADNFVSQLQSLLNGNSNVAGKRYEVLNFGVERYGTAQELLLLRRTVFSFKPDLVILAFYIGNDVRENSLELGSSLREQRPYFSVRHSKLERVPGVPDKTSYIIYSGIIPLFNRLRLLQYLKEGRDHLRVFSLISPRPGRLVYSEEARVFEPGHSAKWDRAWKITEFLIAAFAQEVRDHKAEFLLLTIPDPISVNPNKALRSKILGDLHLFDFTYPEKRLSKLASRAGFAIVNSRSDLQQHATETGRFLLGYHMRHGDSEHLNEEGHRQLARVLMKKIEPLL